MSFLNLNIDGKTILVTGAAKGIGREIALACAKEGANIALHYQTSEEDAIETANEIEKLGAKVVTVQCDLASLEEVEEMKAVIEKKLGKVEQIVNNAGLAQYKSFFKYEPGEWTREVDVCLYGVIHLAYTFIPDMVKKNEGKFINIVGDSARTGDRNLIISGAARSGAISFFKSLAQDIGRHHIQCNTVALGLIDQQQFDAGQRDKILKQYPTKRLGEADDVAGAILFLLSSSSNWITGQVIPVNGGHSMMG